MKFLNFKKIVLTLIIFTSFSAHAYWDKGHSAICQLAIDNLSEESKKEINKIGQFPITINLHSDLIAELREQNKAMESRLGVFEKQVAAQRESLLEAIPEDERVHYENMNLEQLRHFVRQKEAPDVSNPAEAVQGRTNQNVNLDSFMENDDKFKRQNFGELLKAYDRKSTRKQKVN